MDKIMYFVRTMFDKPEEKLKQLAYVVTFGSAVIGFLVTFAFSFIGGNALGRITFGTIVSGFFGGLLSAVIYGIVGYILGISLCCYGDFLISHRRKTEAIERMADTVCNDGVHADKAKRML